MSGTTPSKSFIEIEAEIATLINDIERASHKITRQHCERFFEICDRISFSIHSLSASDKKILYSKIYDVTRHLHKSGATQSLFKTTKARHSFNKSKDFLTKYIEFRKKSDLSIEDYRELIQILSKERNLAKTSTQKNGKTIIQIYDEAFIYKKRGKVKQYNDCLHEIKKFIDREAFKHFSILQLNTARGRSQELGALTEDYKTIRKQLFDGGTLVDLEEKAFLREYKQFFLDIFDKEYTRLYCNAYSIISHNPFNVISNTWFHLLGYFPDTFIASIFFDDKHRSEFHSHIFKGYDGDFFGGYDKNKIPSYDPSLLENYFNIPYDFFSEYSHRLIDFTLDDISFFERSALPQEKPVILDHPDHPEKGKPVIASHPEHPDEGKPKITDHGKKPETSLKEQIADRSKEQEDIKDMYSLPPSEALEDKTLSETLLSYSFIKALPLLRKNTASLLSKSFISLEKLFSAYLPKFSFSTVTSLKRTKKPVYFKEATFNGNNMASDGDSKKAKVRSRTIVNKKTVPVTKGDLLGRGGFVVTGIFIGLEVLHARLENAGYKRAASFVPVTSNWRPWGEAYFSTVDYNLGINPAAGYSTTRLFTHTADGTAYVVEGLGNILYSAGEAERFVYRSFLTEKTAGFDTGRLGIINGVGDAIGSFIDCMGGSFEIRRAKAQAEFRSNISSYETPLGKKMRISKSCIDRGLSHLPKEKAHMNRIKKISGTYSQTKKQMKHSLLHDYMPTEIGNSILNIKIGHLNKDPFKVIKILKPNNCLKRYVKKPVLGTISIPKKNVPKFNTSVVNADIMIIQR